jgi:hypothetical protein
MAAIKPIADRVANRMGVMCVLLNFARGDPVLAGRMHFQEHVLKRRDGTATEA